MKTLKKIVEKLEEIGEICGLKINKSKSNHIININSQNIESINNIKVVNSIKYLGITINEGRNCFKDQKKEKIMSAKQYANMMMTVIARSSNKLMIGKTYWKNVILPEVLYGAEVITYNKTEIADLQKAENQAYRQILGAPRFSPVCTLRAEVGSSLMESRDKENKINFTKHLLQSENELLRSVAELDFNDKTTKLSKTVHKYMEELAINKTDLLNKSKQQLKNLVTALDTEKWNEERNSKSTLAIYNRFKTSIKEENEIYDNTEESKLLFKARTNTLNLKWRDRFRPNSEVQDRNCPMCLQEEETLEHFLLSCQSTSSIRDKHEFWESGNPDQMLKTILCFGKEKGGKKMLKDLWNFRKSATPN